MLLRIGEVPTLVLSSREAAREVMKTHDASFATRQVSATMGAFTDGGRNIIFAPYGEHWRQLRKIAITELLSARRVLSFRGIREAEVAAMLRAVAAAAGERPVQMRARLCALVSDVTVRAVIGDRCKDRDLFLRQVDRINKIAAGFNPADLWPSSRIARRLSGDVRRARECRDTVFGILDGIVKERLERVGSSRGGREADHLEVLLKIQRDDGLLIPLDMDVIKYVIFVSISSLAR
jgi:cytochrome P450